MIYIDKQQNIADGERYTRDYLEDSYDPKSGIICTQNHKNT